MSGRGVESSTRRSFVKGMGVAGALSLATGGSLVAATSASSVTENRIRTNRVRALLLSATTLAGRGSMEHAREHLRQTYGDARELLLLNFASLPQDRDAYEARMQRDFAAIDQRFRVRSLHRAELAEAGRWVREAEGFFVSGGNTFLLLRALYDRYVVELLRERVLGGAPYAGSSAGSNIAGIEIGTTNDFPICDVPTRRSLGLFPGLYNPHHPERSEEADFASRQWKIGQYCQLWPNKPVIGVTNPGMIRIEGTRLNLLGVGAAAFVQRADRKATVLSDDGGDLSAALESVAG